MSAKELNHTEYKHVYTGTVYGHRTLVTHFFNDMMAKEKNSQAEKCREKSQFPYLLSNPFPPPPPKKKKRKKEELRDLKFHHSSTSNLILGYTCTYIQFC